MSVLEQVTPINRMRVVGKAIRPVEDLQALTGDAIYLPDFDMPDSYFVGICRSPYAHAKILNVDLSDALKIDGVVAGLTGKDLIDLQYIRPMVGTTTSSISTTATNIKFFQHYCLAHDKARFVGEPVAAILAKTQYIAEDAVEHIKVTYEPLQPVMNPEDAISPESPLIYENWPDNVAASFKVSSGDVEKSFREADLTVKERIEVSRQAVAPMETRGVFAKFQPREKTLTVWDSTQQPHNVASLLEKTIQIPGLKVRVIEHRVGGGFGVKWAFYPEEVLISTFAIMTGHPVKWVATRSEDMLCSYHGRGQIHNVEAAVRKDGTILGLRDKILADVGAAYNPYASFYSVVNSAHYLPNAYRISNYDGEAISISTNKTPIGPFRGFGKAEPNFVIERLVDIIADKLGLDPTEIRLKNFIPHDAFPYEMATGSRYDSGNYQLALEKVLKLSEYWRWKDEQRKLRNKSRYIGIGTALVVEATSCTRPVGQVGGYYGVRIVMDPNGMVHVFLGGSDEGQSHATSVSQLVSEELQIPLKDVQVIEGDTLECPTGSGSYSSRFAVVGATAVIVATRKLKEKILTVASQILQSPSEELEIADGEILVRKDPNRKIAVKKAADSAYNDTFHLSETFEPGLEVNYQQRNPNIRPFFDERGRAGMFSSFPYDAAVAVVEVDVETGKIEILKYVSVHDCGPLINPIIVESQHQGATAHGVGSALYESVAYDESGQPLTGTFTDYFMPTVFEIPTFTFDHIETPNPFTPGGFKGAGETGTISAPAAIANAVEDALKPFNIKIRKIPLSPEYVLSLIKKSVEDKNLPKAKN